MSELNFEKAADGLGEELFQAAARAWELADDPAAFQLFLKGAKAGHTACQNNVGYCYDTGKGVERDQDAALRWYRLPYEGGDASAACNIGTVWRDRGEPGRALWWFHRGLRLGDGDTLLEIGRLHEAAGRLRLAERAYGRAPAEASITEAGRVACRWGLRRVRRSLG